MELEVGHGPVHATDWLPVHPAHDAQQSAGRREAAQDVGPLVIEFFPVESDTTGIIGSTVERKLPQAGGSERGEIRWHSVHIHSIGQTKLEIGSGGSVGPQAHGGRFGGSEEIPPASLADRGHDLLLDLLPLRLQFGQQAQASGCN